jgi:hypothetical protein
VFNPDDESYTFTDLNGTVIHIAHEPGNVYVTVRDKYTDGFGKTEANLSPALGDALAAALAQSGVRARRAGIQAARNALRDVAEGGEDSSAG